MTTRSSSATVTTSTSFELASSHARVTSIKFTKQESVSDKVVNLIDVTLACKDTNSKLFDVVTVVDVDAEDYVGNSLLQIWKLRFGQKAKLLFKL